MFELLIALIVCAVAGLYDFKKGIIPNQLTFGLIGLSIILLAFNPTQIIDKVIVTLPFFLFCWILNKKDLIGGGDVKLFIGLILLLPVTLFLPILILSLISAGAYLVVTKKQFSFQFRYAPFIFLAVFLTSIHSLLLTML